MQQSDIMELFAALAVRTPSPRSELHFATPFQLLVAVILSAQSTDVGVNRVTPGLFAVAPTPAALVELGVAEIVEHIRSLGLFNNKAQHLLAMSRMLCERFGGAVPERREELESLPGVGRKTANVVLNVAFGQPVIAVDTHVFRVANRTGLAPGSTPLAVESRLERVVPRQYLHHAHHWLILHGRHVCRARQPRCGECVIYRWCEFPEKVVTLSGW